MKYTDILYQIYHIYEIYWYTVPNHHIFQSCTRQSESYTRGVANYNLICQLCLHVPMGETEG